MRDFGIFSRDDEEIEHKKVLHEDFMSYLYNDTYFLLQKIN